MVLRVVAKTPFCGLFSFLPQLLLKQFFSAPSNKTTENKLRTSKSTNTKKAAEKGQEGSGTYPSISSH